MTAGGEICFKIVGIEGRVLARNAASSVPNDDDGSGDNVATLQLQLHLQKAAAQHALCWLTMLADDAGYAGWLCPARLVLWLAAPDTIGVQRPVASVTVGETESSSLI
jgi:hypothetical protein